MHKLGENLQQDLFGLANTVPLRSQFTSEDIIIQQDIAQFQHPFLSGQRTNQ